MTNAMVRREACFICTSPFQVLGAISIVAKERMEADLFLIGTFRDSEIVADRIRKYSLFNNVYFVDPKKIGIRGKIDNIKKIIFAEGIVNKFLDKNVSYDRYYYTSRSLLKSALLKVLLDRNPEMKRIIFDEGMGTYSGNGRLLSVSMPRRVLEKMMRWKLDDPKKTEILAYLPDLVKYEKPFDSCIVHQMPYLDYKGDMREMMRDLFAIPEDGIIREQCIIFDTKRNETASLSSEQLDILDQCYEKIIHYTGKDKVILKPHPRSTKPCPDGIGTYPYTGIPMEALYTFMPDLQDRILISFVSSAVFTPKILFDKEAVVICLHRLFKGNETSAVFEDIFQKMRGAYRQPERVIAPNTVEELEEQLQTINSLLKHT